MSTMLDQLLTDRQRREAEEADCALADTIVQAVNRAQPADVSKRAAYEAIAHYRAVAALPQATLEEARDAYIRNTSRAPVTMNNAQLFHLGMLCGVRRVLGLLEAKR